MTATAFNYDYTANTLVGIDKRKFMVTASSLDSPKQKKPIVGTIDYLVRRVQEITRYLSVEAEKHNGGYEIICSDEPVTQSICTGKTEYYDFSHGLVVPVYEVEMEAA